MTDAVRFVKDRFGKTETGQASPLSDVDGLISIPLGASGETAEVRVSAGELTNQDEDHELYYVQLTSVFDHHPEARVFYLIRSNWVCYGERINVPYLGCESSSPAQILYMSCCVTIRNGRALVATWCALNGRSFPPAEAAAEPPAEARAA